MERLKITKLAGHACCRVQKMALPLIERGHRVHLISQKTPSFAETYDTVTKAYSIHQFREAIKLHKAADIFHAHNEPSWFVTVIKEHLDKPVILDVHDSYLARVTPEHADMLEEAGEEFLRITVEERNNFQLADGLVFPSQPFADLIIKEFKLTQPYIVLPSFVQRNLYSYAGKRWMGGLVYEGRVDLSKDVSKSAAKTGFEYTVYEDLAQKAHDLNINFHLYARKDDAFKEVYKDIAFIHEPKPYDKLFGAVARHDWGLVGNLHPTPEWNVAFPNKLFEYIAAGVPVVSINAAECSRFIEQHGVGITVNSLEELAARWGEHTEIRKVILKKRMRWCMEENIQELENLYVEVIDGFSKDKKESS